MTFHEFRDKASWAALLGAFVIVFGQWAVHKWFVDTTVWVDNTPPLINFVGMILTGATLVLGLLTLPRWQSFIALLACV